MTKKHDEPEWDRGFLKSMAWVGTGVWTMTGGVLKGMSIEQAARKEGRKL